MKTLRPLLSVAALATAVPNPAAQPRLDLRQVEGFKVPSVSPSSFRLRFLAGRPVLFVLEAGIPILRDPEALAIPDGTSVRCTMGAEDGKPRMRTKRVPWRELKALLLSDFPPVGKGSAFFAGTVVLGAEGRRRELLQGEGKDRIPLESGAPLPPGPVLILGRLDEARASSFNRLEPYLVVEAWTDL